MTVRTLIGDCREILPTLAADSFDCIVTSPPYFGLRDYGVTGQIGLEPTLQAYVDVMAEVGRELWRVLKPSGTFWLNLGDSYNASPGQRKATDKPGAKQATNGGAIGAPSRSTPGLKPKDLCLVPERVAMRLQADGWWIRSRIIWAKPNAMPESVIDRPTSAHEHVWMLTKSATYWYDADAIREPGVGREDDAHGLNGEMRHPRKVGADKQRGHSRRHDGFNDRWDAMTKAEQCAKGANSRNVWTIAPQPYKWLALRDDAAAAGGTLHQSRLPCRRLRSRSFRRRGHDRACRRPPWAQCDADRTQSCLCRIAARAGYRRRAPLRGVLCNMTSFPFREDDEINLHADRDLATLKRYNHLEKMACKSRAELSRANAIRGGKARKSPPVTLARIEIGKGMAAK